MASPEGVKSFPGLKISLVYSPAARQVREWQLELDLGATVAMALSACRIMEEFTELQSDRLRVGVWGRKTILGYLLQDSDRVEIYRSLRVDPKVARRERFNSQGAKSAGLFAKIRPGAKAGY